MSFLFSFVNAVIMLVPIFVFRRLCHSRFRCIVLCPALGPFVEALGHIFLSTSCGQYCLIYILLQYDANAVKQRGPGASAQAAPINVHQHRHQQPSR